MIIPTYNRQFFLLEAVKSVIAQTYRPIECIIVDDGSTDSTKTQVDKIAAEGDENFTIKYIYQANSGSQVARNTGTKSSAGEFIQYLDSDDLLYPEKIEKQVVFLKSNDDCDAVFGDWDKGTFQNREFIEAYESNNMISQLLSDKIIHTLAFLYRRRIVNKIGEWDITIRRNQEIDFQVRGLLKRAVYKYQPLNCGLWRIHPEERIANTTGLKEIHYFFNKWEARLLPLNLFSAEIKKNISNIYFWSVNSSTLNTQAEKLNILLEAIRLNPRISFINTEKMKALRRVFGLKNALRIWLLRNQYVSKMSPFTKAKLWQHKIVQNLLVNYFKQRVGNNKFCIISNDCWGAEMYKLLDRPFNTPFIGLMLMSPCYIKMLQNPFFYINEPLVFKEHSRYPEMQQIKSGTDFPLAVLGESDIEVHFLHYKSKEEAKQKWDRRVKRIDWQHLFVKYDCGKDYATAETVGAFNELNIPNKLLFGKENFGYKEVFVIDDYPKNAVQQFRSCFLSFNPVGWLLGDKAYKNKFDKWIGKLAFQYV